MVVVTAEVVVTTWLTVAALAARTGHPTSTLRHWRSVHRAWIPERLDEHGQRTHPLDRIEEIAALYAKRLRQREVNDALERRHGSPDGEPAPAQATDDVLREVRELRTLVERIAEHLGVPLEGERNAP